jgi:ribosome recycling factor
MISVIEKEIQKSDIGINPLQRRQGDPPLGSGADRGAPQGPVQAGAQAGREGKVAVRAIRRDAMEHLKKMKKDSQITEDEQSQGETDLQKTTDSHTSRSWTRSVPTRKKRS